ncbi:la-related protein 6 isoform X2 [Sapajus apella]|uniref:La-related protein 6 isoform X2 n=1 Tax=Sapajus apella TaxID=9515 RepID=A0A6J3F4Z1_SAPAP|nr:la-related protein 6 isoform X2 [Sapajus apella]
MAQSGGEARPGPETAVQIRVAIQEAEDVDELEDEEEGAETRGAGDPARYLSPGWGSASEEEPSRGHRNRSSVNSGTMLVSFAFVSSAPSPASSTWPYLLTECVSLSSHSLRGVEKFVFLLP